MKGLTFKLEEWRDGKTQGEMTRQGWKVISSQELSQGFHKEKIHTWRGGSLGERNLMIIANKCISIERHIKVQKLTFNRRTLDQCQR